MNARSISIRYGEATTSFVAFARTLSEHDWATPVPCTPLWTARELLSHVTGVPDDGLAGRLDGPATEPWTASQVERNAEFGVDELLERFEQQYEIFGAAIESMGEERPAYDCHSHEHDLRHALGRPGNRESMVIVDCSNAMVASLAEVSVSIAIDFGGGDVVNTGHGDAAVSIAMSRFEMFRSRLGRRSREQVRSLPWDGDDAAIETVLDSWFLFGPSVDSIVEE